jgi:hypothetical protein
MMKFGLICKKYPMNSMSLSLNSVEWVNFGALYLKIIKDFALDQYSKLVKLC